MARSDSRVDMTEIYEYQELSTSGIGYTSKLSSLSKKNILSEDEAENLLKNYGFRPFKVNMLGNEKK